MDDRAIEGPALGLLELESIARGIAVADVLVKRAQVRIARAEAVTPGKYLLIFHGEVAEVDESFRAAKERAGSTLLDELFLAKADPQVLGGLFGAKRAALGESVGIVETQTVASALLALDTAVKRAEVGLRLLELARGIGGKGYFVLTGELHMVQAAVEGAAAAIAPELLLTTELIEQPDPVLWGGAF